jgi:hypothetical protein
MRNKKQTDKSKKPFDKLKFPKLNSGRTTPVKFKKKTANRQTKFNLIFSYNYFIDDFTAKRLNGEIKFE